MVEPYKPIYTVAEAAKVLRTSKSTVYDLMRDGNCHISKCHLKNQRQGFRAVY